MRCAYFYNITRLLYNEGYNVLQFRPTASERLHLFHYLKAVYSFNIMCKLLVNSQYISVTLHFCLHVLINLINVEVAEHPICTALNKDSDSKKKMSERTRIRQDIRVINVLNSLLSENKS